MLKINKLGLPKAFTMDSHFAQCLQNGTRRIHTKDNPLLPGIGKKPLTELQLSNLKERKAQIHARRKIQETIDRIRRERGNLDELVVMADKGASLEELARKKQRSK